MKKILIVLGILGLVFSGFADDYKTYFSRYVAIGDSITAGFQDGGLVDYYQNVSFPKLLADRAGAATFEMPLVSPPGIPPVLTLIVDASGNFNLAPSSTIFGVPENLNYPAPYNNLAVPGADTHDVLYTVTDNGGYHDLVLRGLGTQLQQAIALNPTLITLWIGNNDVLGAVLVGRVIEGVTITPVAVFERNLRKIVATLKQKTNAKIVMLNIPQVTLIPFANYVKPYIEANGQKIYLIGPKGLLTDNDLVLLSALPYIYQGIGVPIAAGGTGLPLPDEVVLDSSEKAKVMGRVNKFNSIIKQVSSEYDIPLLDINGLFQNAATEGITIGGVTFTNAYLTGGLFSLDGVHPSTMGHALIANYLIELMNENFDWEMPLIDLSKYFWTSPRPSSSTAVTGYAVDNLIKMFRPIRDRVHREK